MPKPKKQRHYNDLLNGTAEAKKKALAAAPPGHYEIECHECQEEDRATVDAEGVMRLPKGWHWKSSLCNWGDGVTLKIEHVRCPYMCDETDNKRS